MGDTDQFRTDICSAVSDFATKDNQQVLEGIVTILHDLPQLHSSMEACPDAAADFAVIANWFKYWKGQGEMKVYSTAYKNIVGNMGHIKDDASKISNDFSSQNFYQAAFDSADIARTALPLPALEVSDPDPTCMATLNSKADADFLAGFIANFTGNDHKDYLETCFKDTDQFRTDICSAVSDFATKDNQQVLEGIVTILHDLPQLHTAMDACPDAAADFAVVANWFKYWKGQGEMKVYSTAYKNIVGNMDHIKEDATKISGDFSSQNFYQAAWDSADIAKTALPVMTLGDGVTPYDTCMATINTEVDAEFLAGFIGSFTGHDHLDEMKTCYTDTDQFRTDICNAVADFATKDNQKVLEGIQKIMTDLPQLNASMSKCPADVQTDWAVVANWWKYWKGQGEMKVYSTAYKNLVGNMAEVKADAQKINDDFYTSNYQSAAYDAGTLAKLALPMPPAMEGEENFDCALNAKEEADFLAGFIFGFTGHDQKAYLESCYHDTPQFETDICNAVNDFSTKDNQN